MLETGGVVDVVEVLNARESVHKRGHGCKEGMVRDREGERSGEAEYCTSREEVAKHCETRRALAL